MTALIANWIGTGFVLLVCAWYFWFLGGRGIVHSIIRLLREEARIWLTKS